MGESGSGKSTILRCGSLLNGNWEGEVRIGVSSMLGSYYFPPLLMAFKARYPDIKLSVIEGGTLSLHESMLVDTAVKLFLQAFLLARTSFGSDPGLQPGLFRLKLGLRRRQLRSLMQRIVLHTRKRLMSRAYRHWHTTTLFEQLVHNSASLQALHERHNSLVSHADSLSARPQVNAP